LYAQCHHHQILEHNDRLKAVISISPPPYLEKIAAILDDEQDKGNIHGALHGIPFIVKVST